MMTRVSSLHLASLAVGTMGALGTSGQAVVLPKPTYLRGAVCASRKVFFVLERRRLHSRPCN
eukprot:11218675-Lingulodinium_polyedra.AAC.1